MKIIESDKVAFFDCDGTLVDWLPGTAKDGEPVVLLGLKPYKVFKRNLENLIEHSKRGHKIVIWSAGGWEWAKMVVKLLEIESYVDLVISKPMWAYDDLPAAEIIPRDSRRFYE